MTTSPIDTSAERVAQMIAVVFAQKPGTSVSIREILATLEAVAAECDDVLRMLAEADAQIYDDNEKPILRASKSLRIISEAIARHKGRTTKEPK